MPNHYQLSSITYPPSKTRWRTGQSTRIRKKKWGRLGGASNLVQKQNENPETKKKNAHKSTLVIYLIFSCGTRVTQLVFTPTWRGRELKKKISKCTNWLLSHFLIGRKRKKKNILGTTREREERRRRKKPVPMFFLSEKIFLVQSFHIRIHTCNIYTYYIIIILPSCCNVEEKKILSIVHHVFFSLGSFLASGVRFLLNFIEVR